MTKNLPKFYSPYCKWLMLKSEGLVKKDEVEKRRQLRGTSSEQGGGRWGLGTGGGDGVLRNFRFRLGYGYRRMPKCKASFWV